MGSLLPFVERRSRRRLLKAALRRRNQGRPSAILQERRADGRGCIDVASMLELHLDRYPTNAAMLAFVQSLVYAADAHSLPARETAYTHALRQASDLLRTTDDPRQALATLHGYQRFIARRSSTARRVAA
jgi:hypothetical protein